MNIILNQGLGKQICSIEKNLKIKKDVLVRSAMSG